MKNLTKGKPLKLIISFAIPIFIGNFLQLCYNIADTRIVGITLGTKSLAAVGAASVINSLLIAIVMGFTNGFSVILSHAFGAKDNDCLRKAFASSVILGLLIALILSFSLTVFLKPVLQILHTKPEIFDESYQYIRILILGMVITMLYNLCASSLRAIGDSITPLIILMCSALLNIGLDLLLIRCFHLGVKGAAIATILCQVISVIASIAVISKKYTVLRFSLSDIDVNLIKTLFLSGLSMSLMMSFVYFGTLSLQRAINVFDKEIIVAHTAARRITELYMLPFSAFGTTLTTYCSQNFGAGQFKRIKTGIIEIILLTWLWCFLVMAASYTVAPQMIEFVTGSSDSTVISYASKYLRFNTLFYMVPAVITLVRSSMQGIEDHITPVISSSIELIGKVLIALFLAPTIGYMGIIVAEPIVWCLMVIPLIIMIVKNPVMHT